MIRSLTVCGLIFGLALIGFDADSAIQKKSAQQVAKVTKKKAKKTQKSSAASERKIKAIVAAPSAQAPQVQAVPAQSEAVKAQSAGEIKAPLAEQVKAAKPSAWGFQYDSQTQIDMAQVNRGNLGEPSSNPGRSEDRVHLKYKWSDLVSTSLAFPFAHTWFGTQAKDNQDNTVINRAFSNFLPRDLYFQTAISEIGTFGGDGKLSLVNRLYFPTSVASQDAGQIASDRLYLNADKTVGRLSVSLTLAPHYYFQQYTSTSSSPTDPADVSDWKTPIANRNYRLISGLGLVYELSDKVSLEQDINFDDSTYHAVPALAINEKRTVDFNPETYLIFKVSKAVELWTGIGQEYADMQDMKNGLNLYRDDEGSYYFTYLWVRM